MISSRLETVPELAKRLNAPVWLIRRLADQLTADQGGCPRLGKLMRLISPELATRIETALAARKEREVANV
jgi:hypothetical protein